MRSAQCTFWKHYYSSHFSFFSVLLIVLAFGLVPLSSNAQVTFLGDNHLQKANSRIDEILPKGDSLFIVALTSPLTGDGEYDVFLSDGTEAGTTNLTEHLRDSVAIYEWPENLTQLGNEVIFSSARSLYKTDGTVAGTVVLLDGLTDVNYLTAAGSYVFFAADDNVHGLELWRTDGTVAGTQMVKDIDPRSIPIRDGKPNNFMALGSSVLFSATTEDYGIELWISDGTTAGTQLVADLNVGTSGVTISNTPSVAYNGSVYSLQRPGWQRNRGMEKRWHSGWHHVAERH